MATYFLDTSALVKRYVPAEQGHAWITDICDPAQGHKLYISQAALVEVVAAMCRKAREQSITPEDRDRLITRVRRDIQSTYNLWQVTTALYTAAGNLCRLHPLRAYDAVQLACVLGLRDRALANQAPSPIFVCADLHLLAIADAEGLSSENPNTHP
jgi:uncharacterized protein